jgi:outer membrane lipoprotein-sorting protein
MLLVLAVAIVVSQAGVWASLEKEVKAATSKFRDLQGTAVVVYKDDAELKKMGKSFARSYEFKKAEIFFKNPDKFRMEGKLGMVKIEYINSGDLRIVRVPSLRYSKKDDVGDEPGKLRASIDIGILTDSLWLHHEVRTLAKEDTPSGEVYVLELARIGDGRRNQKIWVDSKHRILKREKYKDDGSLKARYLFKEHKLIDGVLWTPIRTETYNDKSKLVGISELRNVKVNQGLPDSKFQ